MHEYQDILRILGDSKIDDFLELIEGKKPLFVCTIATTETAKIPGISAAGKNPEFTDYTPPADMEYLCYGRCRCIDGVPVTPDGIPTPALITRTAIKLSGIPMLIVDGGSKIKPQVPFLDVGGQSGSDIRMGRAVREVSSIFERAVIAGRNLASTTEYLVLGESIPGGTTTALSVMLAIGLDAKSRVSSSMPENPHKLKLSVVHQAMAATGVEEGGLEGKPLEAIAMLGDPSQATIAGLIIGAAREVPIIMAGGTQMAAILAAVQMIDPSVVKMLAIGTTRWLIRDPSSDLAGLISQVGDFPVMASNLSFSRSKHQGLQAYELGVVKEGVGAGGVSLSSMVMTSGRITANTLQEEIEREYERIVS